ncbi:hypothetical protein E6C60_4148 [Paenibacillus algicola]|uniref:Uncharacterized protein n=1 Tax=Paenibacillus algicola TaxID=2565926 RepID=A0A4P8XQP8_9BACL|nr:hypothetical protein E6C60_4148 [Paenibacillus algicola]
MVISEISKKVVSYYGKEFKNYATINFNTQDFSYFRSQGIKVISVPK